MYNLGIYADDYNAELAKQLAESSGITEKSIKLINNGSSADALTCELIQADCKRIGVTVEVVTMDPGSWLTTMFDETAYDMCVDIISVPPDTFSGSYQMSILYLAGGSYVNYQFEGHDRALEILNNVMSNDDVDERKAMIYELAQISTEQMLWYNLVTPTSAVGMNDGLGGEIRDGYNFIGLFRNLYWK